MKFRLLYFPMLVFLICMQHVLSGQQILLDKPVRAGELILFPEVTNENVYYYLPDKPRLAFHPDGTPQFSFIRYVKNELTDASSNNAITESSKGGGIIHALVELSVTDEQIRAAERALRRIDGDGQIRGPVIFKSGSVALISAVAKPNGEMAEQVVGLGSAPILENQRSAVAVQLNQMGSKILWESFNTPTPDFTFNFEMEVEGYLSPKRVLIEADFDRIYKHRSFEAGAAAQMGPALLAAEIKSSFDELTDQGAIKVTQIGSDEELDKLKETAYNQLINLMFDKVGGTGVPQLSELAGGGRKSMLDRATENLQKARAETSRENARIDNLRAQYARQEANVRNGAQQRADARFASQGRQRPNVPAEQRRAAQAENAGNNSAGGSISPEEIPERQPMPNLSVAVSYQMKEVRRSGKYTIDLNKYTETTRSMPFAYNPGNVKAGCAPCFLEVNLDDPLMKQREINATLGGINAEDFEYINFVNVIIQKEHQNGQQTVDEVKIDQSQFDEKGNFFKMLYGWKGDDNRSEWLNYNFRTFWSFEGGHSIQTDWEATDFGSIALTPPVVRKPVYIEVDEDFIYDEGVRGVELKFYSQVNGKTTLQTVNLKTQKNELSKTVEILLPRDVEDYEYELTYFIKGKDPKKTERKASNYGRIDVDRFL